MKRQLGTYVTQRSREDLQKITNLGRIRFSCFQVIEYMKALPQVTVQVTATALKMSPPTARSALNVLVEIGVLTETSSRKRDKTYVYKKYLEILEEGCEPLGASA